MNVTCFYVCSATSFGSSDSRNSRSALAAAINAGVSAVRCVDIIRPKSLQRVSQADQGLPKHPGKPALRIGQPTHSSLSTSVSSACKNTWHSGQLSAYPSYPRPSSIAFHLAILPWRAVKVLLSMMVILDAAQIVHSVRYLLLRLLYI